MRRLTLASMGCAALLVLTGTESSFADEAVPLIGGGSAATPQAASPLLITKRATLKEAFEIRLEANATTGYSWAIDGGEGLARLKIVGDTYEAPDSAVGNSAVGAPGAQVFHFIALAPGQAKLRFTYWRPWQPNEPARTAEALITIE